MRYDITFRKSKDLPVSPDNTEGVTIISDTLANAVREFERQYPGADAAYVQARGGVYTSSDIDTIIEHHRRSFKTV